VLLIIMWPDATPTALLLQLLLNYGWMQHNAGFDFLDLTPSILLLRQFWD
jgi:hypothetical protein